MSETSENSTKKDGKKFRIFATVWIILSLVYLANDAWGYITNTIIKQSYLAGQTSAINALLDKALEKECKPFNVYAGERKADVISVACLQSPQTEPTKVVPKEEPKVLTGSGIGAK